MIRRNIDFLAIAIVALGMTVISRIPPPRTAINVIRYQMASHDSPQNQDCPLQRFLSRIVN